MKNLLLKIFIIFALCSVLAALLLTPPNQLSKGISFTFAKVTTDENAVFSTILKELIIKDDVKFLIISNQTEWSKYPPSYLTYNLEIPVKYILINRANYDHRVLTDETNSEGENKPRITDLLNKNTGAVYVGLSKIDFNEERTEAFVYVESFGQGRKISLEKESGLWKIREISEVWTS